MPDERDWRVGHKGRDSMYYEERHLGAWQRLEIQGEMLTGRAHHVIYFDGPARWRQYPAWARDRRDVIIARIMSEFREPDYEYDGIDGGAPASLGDMAAGRGGATPHSSPSTHASVVEAMTAQQRGALMLAIVITLSIAAVMGWLVTTGLGSGTSRMPSARPSQQRSVSRLEEPGFYWTAIGIYSTLGLVTLGLGAFGMREMLRRHA